MSFFFDVQTLQIKIYEVYATPIPYCHYLHHATPRHPPAFPPSLYLHFLFDVEKLRLFRVGWVEAENLQKYILKKTLRLQNLQSIQSK